MYIFVEEQEDSKIYNLSHNSFSSSGGNNTRDNVQTWWSKNDPTTNQGLQCQSRFTIPFHESLDRALSIVAVTITKDILKKNKHNIGHLKEKDMAGLKLFSAVPNDFGSKY